MSAPLPPGPPSRRASLPAEAPAVEVVSTLALMGVLRELAPLCERAVGGKLAATFLARDDGPRIAMIETGGWDTHSAQNARLANQLKALDTMIAALRDGLGPAWQQTTVLVATEFGRTAAANGTGGTDHGQASVAMLTGGAVAGGRVIADWPGLRPGDLYEGRDLKPTASLDALGRRTGAEGHALGIRLEGSGAGPADAVGRPRDTDAAAVHPGNSRARVRVGRPALGVEHPPSAPAVDHDLRVGGAVVHRVAVQLGLCESSCSMAANKS